MKLLSIVIPTKDRPAQCVATVQSVLAYRHDFELVVFDSSATEALRGALPEDPRLRWVRAGGDALNMTQCFEAAVRQATGRYVCMIGDDDGVTPALFDWAARCEREVWTSATSHPDTYAAYNWPDIRSKYFGAAASGKLFMHLADAPEAAPADLPSALSSFLEAAGQGCAALPRVYHGLVRRDVLDDMRQRVGCCFDGVSPDVSFSYFAALSSPRHVVIRDPLTISGASAASNAGRSAMRVHKGDLWSDPHMKHFQQAWWPAQVPEFFSVETVWAQATLAALRRAAPPGGARAPRYNIERLHALLLLRHPDRWREIVAAMRAARRPDSPARLSWPAFAAAMATALAGHVAGGARKLWRKVAGARGVKTFGAASIVDASLLVQGELKGRS